MWIFKLLEIVYFPFSFFFISEIIWLKSKNKGKLKKLSTYMHTLRWKYWMDPRETEIGDQIQFVYSVSKETGEVWGQVFQHYLLAYTVYFHEVEYIID